MSLTRTLRWPGRLGVLALFILLASQSASGQGRLYWTEPNAPAIMSSNFDGSSQVTAVQGYSLEELVDVDIDQVTGWVYWADQGSYRISRVSPDGREGGPIFPYVHAPYGIAVDGTNGYLYWTEKSAIKRSHLDGTDAVDLVTSFEWPRPLEISTGDNLMFWSIESGGTYHSKLDGTDIQKISDAGSHYLAVDDVHKKVFIPVGMKIVRTNFDGAAVDTVVTSTSYIFGLAVEPAADRLCWAQRAPVPLGETPGPAEIMCASTDGSNVTKLAEVNGVPEGLAINHQSRMLYFAPSLPPVYLMRCQYDGSGLEKLTASMIHPVDVAVDPIRRKVYWADGQFPQYRVPFSNLDGTDPQAIEIELPGPLPPLDGLDVQSAVALDPTNRNVYVGTEGSIGVPTTLIPGRVIMGSMDGPINNVIESGSYETVFDIETDVANGKIYYVGHLGELWQRNLDGSDPLQLKTGVGSGIAVSSHYLYWLDLASKTLRRGNHDGTQPVDLLSGVEPIRDLVVDASDQNLWWTTPGSDTIMRFVIGQAAPQAIVTADTEIEGLYVVSPPSNVTLIAPVNGAADLPTTVTLMWSHPSDAERFDVQVASADDINSVIFASNTPKTQETFVAPNAESSYFWRVRSTGAGGGGPFTEYAAFTVSGSGPLAASLVAPASGETGVAVHPTFRWMKAPDAVYHDLQVSDTTSFASPLIDVDSLAVDSLDGVVLDHDKTYYWRVGGFSEDGKYTFTVPWQFTTVIAPPEAVTLTSPEASATGVPAYATFTWQEPSSAESYRLEVATDASFTNLIVNVETADPSHELAAPLAYDMQFYWRVRAANPGGDGAWSETRSFHTVIGTATEDDGVPSTFALYQNYPNPFGRSTQIRYDLPRPEQVRIVVYDALGREVEQLVDKTESAGAHVVTFEAADRPGGLYVYRMQAGSFERTRPMIVAK